MTPAIEHNYDFAVDYDFNNSVSHTVEFTVEGLIPRTEYRWR